MSQGKSADLDLADFFARGVEPADIAPLYPLLGARGLRLSWGEYLGDDRERLAATFKRTIRFHRPSQTRNRIEALA